MNHDSPTINEVMALHDVSELQEAILGLPEAGYTELRRCLTDEDWERWERESDEDARARKLDALAAEA